MTLYRCRNSVQLLIDAADDAVVSGGADLNLEKYREEIKDAEPVNLELIGGLLDRALEMLTAGELAKETTLDQWLAPRLHAALRISRRFAGDMGFWTWLVLHLGRRYTWERWKETEKGRIRPSAYRYTGDFKRNALARLWWFAEMARNGPDYSPIKDILRDPSTAQYAMELKYSMYRPAVIAFGRVAMRRKLGFNAMKRLSKRINAYLSLRALEAMGLDPSDDVRDRTWWADTQTTLGELLTDRLPVGPQDGFASARAIADLDTWFDNLAQEGENAIASAA